MTYRELITTRRPGSEIAETLEAVWDKVVAGSPYLSVQSGAATQVMLLRMRLEVNEILAQVHDEAIDVLTSAYLQADRIVEEARLEAGNILILASEPIGAQRPRPAETDQPRPTATGYTETRRTQVVERTQTIRLTDTIERTETIHTSAATARNNGRHPPTTRSRVTPLVTKAQRPPAIEWEMANSRSSDRDYPGQLDETDESWLVALREAMDDDGPLDDLEDSPPTMELDREGLAGQDPRDADQVGDGDQADNDGQSGDDDQERRRPWRRVKA